MADEFQIRDEFPPVTYEQWRAVAEADLKGAAFEQKLVTHIYEDIDIQPVYTGRDALHGVDASGLPGQTPFVRGAHAVTAEPLPWDLRQEYQHPELKANNRAILDDLAGGATSLLIRLDQIAGQGHDPDDPASAELAQDDGVMAYSAADLDRVLADVQLDAVGVSLEAGAAFIPGAALLVSLWKKRGVAPDQARGSFHADPLGELARRGRLPLTIGTALSQLADLAAWTAQNYPGVTAVGVDTSPYHQAGATAAQDIALGVATGLEYLKAMLAAGLDVATASRQMVFDLSVGTHHFLAIAKLRAARRVWARIIECCGGKGDVGAMRIHARTGLRTLTQRDPYVNLLRNTVGVFAAGIGGAESITSIPFDIMSKQPDEFSRRIARNTLLILQEEARLNHVVDPAGGSWFLEKLTQQVADKAWEIFQQVERRGGMQQALTTGWVSEQVNAAYVPRAKNIARRKQGITGVSEFPNVTEERLTAPPVDNAALHAAAVRRLNDSRPADGAKSVAAATDKIAAAIQAATAGASIGQLAKALGFHLASIQTRPFIVRNFAKPFEDLRDASDAWEAQHGRRPTVFLANMGPVAHHTARATFSKNFFEAGGFAVIGNNGWKDAEAAAAAFQGSGATVAVICSSDKLYPEIVPVVAGKLKAAGAKAVVLAGQPGANEAAWRAAGVDRFIFVKCDVLGTLQEMLRAEGVWQG